MGRLHSCALSVGWVSEHDRTSYRFSGSARRLRLCKQQERRRQQLELGLRLLFDEEWSRKFVIIGKGHGRQWSASRHDKQRRPRLRRHSRRALASKRNKEMKTLIASSAVAAVLALGVSFSAQAQTTTAGSGTSYQGRDVSAGTYGSGTTSPTSIGVSGGGTATAAKGGTASTDSQAKLTERRAMQKSTAVARDDDERARSMTRTQVRKDGVVRSRSRTMYKADGERPVIVRDYSAAGQKAPVKPAAAR